MRTRATFLIVLLLTLGVSAKHRPAPVGISLSPSAWDVRYSSGVKLQALSLPRGRVGHHFIDVHVVFGALG